MDRCKTIELLEYIKTSDEHNSGATKIALDEAIKCIVKIQEIEEAIEDTKRVAGGSYVAIIAYSRIKDILNG